LTKQILTDQDADATDEPAFVMKVFTHWLLEEEEEPEVRDVRI